MKLATSAQMRAMDKKVIEEYGVPSLALMENAALRVVEAVAERWAPLSGKHIGVVCGKGNNGGDGLAAARLLAQNYGADIAVFLVEGDQGLSPDAAANLKLAQDRGLNILPSPGSPVLAQALAGCDLVIDAILGTGITGDPRQEAARAIEAVNQSGRPVVAVDVPSGLNCDNGRVGNPTVKATLTVTLALSKLGLHLFPGLDYAGEVVVGDIGFPRSVLDTDTVKNFVTDPAMVAAWLPSRKPHDSSNKGQYGSVAVLAGSPGFAGAASLAAQGAARAGAGLVTLACPKSLFDVTMARLPETIMTRALASAPKGGFDVHAVSEAMKLCQKMDAATIGCGIGHEDEPTRRFALDFISRCDKPLVIDADALNTLSLQPDHGASVVRARRAATVLTPHPGEMARLLGLSTQEVQADRLGAVREAADRFGCVALLKGARTLIAHPDGRLAVNETGNTGMATGGMGDALTGIAAAFLAQMADPWQATTAAAYVHGLAGDLAATEIASSSYPVGILAHDLLMCLPRAIAQCAQVADG